MRRKWALTESRKIRYQGVLIIRALSVLLIAVVSLVILSIQGNTRYDTPFLAAIVIAGVLAAVLVAYWGLLRAREHSPRSDLIPDSVGNRRKG